MAITALVAEPATVVHGRIVAQTVINALAITDTLNHDCTTDAGSTFLADTRFLTGPKLLYVANGLGQAVTVSLEAGIGPSAVVIVGTGVVVAAATTAWIDVTAYAQLADPYPYMAVNVKAAVAPVAGTITVALYGASA